MTRRAGYKEVRHWVSTEAIGAKERSTGAEKVKSDVGSVMRPFRSFRSIDRFRSCLRPGLGPTLRAGYPVSCEQNA